MRTFFILCIIFGSTQSSFSSWPPEKSICGEDERLPSDDPKIARAVESLSSLSGCTITMISSNCAVSAGHCFDSFKLAQFHTPPSDRNGEIQGSSEENTYLIDQKSIIYQDNGAGHDWAVMRLRPNSVTGKNPGDIQGFYQTRFFGTQEVRAGEFVRVTGYGRYRKEMQRNYTQQSHLGKIVKIRNGILYHLADTMGGNSGSSVIRESDESIIAIHTHGGCGDKPGNRATYLHRNDELQKAIVACVVQDQK